MSSRTNNIPVIGAEREAPARLAIDEGALETFLAEAGTASARAVLASATRVITALLGERGSCILLDGAPRVVLALHSPALTELRIDLDRYPEVRAAMTTGRVVVIDDPQRDAGLAAVREHLPPELRSVVAVPLTAAGRCLGVILVQSSTPRRLETGARDTALLVARIAALVCARAGGPRVGLAPAPAPAPGTWSEGQGSVLVVEDDNALADALVGALTDAGYRALRAADGRASLDLASDAKPDVVVLDINLPGMNGLEVATCLRRSARTQDVPILFLSGTERLAALVREAHLDLVDFMPKPFGIDELLTRIQQAAAQARARQDLLLAAERDELTGVGNLRLFRRSVAAARALFDRYGHPLSVAMIDVDRLKAINDRLGHAAGSQALRAIARVLRRQARDTDVVARYGGDEFVVLLPDTALADARVFCERVSAEVAALPAELGGVTVSIGVASLTGREREDDVLLRADQAAYRAKVAGGNRVCADAAPA